MSNYYNSIKYHKKLLKTTFPKTKNQRFLSDFLNWSIPIISPLPPLKPEQEHFLEAHFPD
jgi:hypothetical protein